MNKLSLAGVISLLLIGCVAEQPQTLDYYKANPKEAYSVLLECRDQGVSQLADSPDARNCRNADRGYKHWASSAGAKESAILRDTVRSQRKKGMAAQ